MPIKYSINSVFSGFRAKEDVTNLPPGVMVDGSQNVLTNGGERVAARQGYTLFGQSNAALTGVQSSYDWLDRFNGEERHLRSYTGELEYLFEASDGSITWRRLANGFGDNVSFNFDTFWNNTEKIDLLLFVNGTNNVYEWSGGVTTFASATANTITKQGTFTWAQEGFYTTGTRSVIINGTTYAYTGGEGTTTLTGVSPDPTGGAYSAGEVIHQAIRTTAMSSFTSGPSATYLVSLIQTLQNHVYYGSFVDRFMYFSKSIDYKDLSFATPRIATDGGTFTLDSPPKAMKVEEEFMYVSGGMNDWFKVIFTESADTVNQSVSIQKLKTTVQQATQSQAFTTKDKNSVVFLSQEPTITTLGRVQLVQTPQNVDLSDPIKNDMNSYNFTGGSILYFQNFLYVAVPAEGLFRMFNIQKQWWEAPQTGQFSRFAIIDGELYAHSSEVPETYKLFTGATDNGAPIECMAAFSYQNFGDRANTKIFNRCYIEGYISSNTILTLRVLYDYKGATGVSTYLINGSDRDILFVPADDGSLGKHSLGKASLAGRELTDDTALPPKFRVYPWFNELDFYEMQFQFESNQEDADWELIAIGNDSTMSTSGNNKLTK